MVAALVLFNGLSALGTLLCVGHDPGYVFTLSGIFKLPLLCCYTICRSVALTSAFEAERITTFALHICYACVLVFYAVITPLIRTPTDIPIIISVGFTKPFFVSLEIIPTQEF